MVMGMYKSPIDIIYGQMQTQMEGDILRAVQSYGINVDKEELIRALQYDRDQYHKGYADGRRDAMAGLVRCKDCKHWHEETGFCDENSHFNAYGMDWNMFADDDFCSRGERRSDGNLSM